MDAVDAVGVGAKRSTDTVYSANKGGGTITFSAKRSLYPHTVGAVVQWVQWAQWAQWMQWML